MRIIPLVLLCCAVSNANADDRISVIRTAVNKAHAALVVVSVRADGETPLKPRFVAGVVVDGAGLVIAPLQEIPSHAEFEIITADATKLPATLAAQDPACGLAILRFNTKKNLAETVMVDDGTVAVGDELFALSYVPLGDEPVLNVQVGLVSLVKAPADDRRPIILIDGAVGPGFAPSIVVDQQGRLVGVLATNHVQGIAVLCSTLQPLIEQARNCTAEASGRAEISPRFFPKCPCRSRCRRALYAGNHCREKAYEYSPLRCRRLGFRGSLGLYGG